MTPNQIPQTHSTANRDALDAMMMAGCQPFVSCDSDALAAQAFALLTFLAQSFEVSAAIGDNEITDAQGFDTSNLIATLDRKVIAEALQGVANLVAVGEHLNRLYATRTASLDRKAA